MVDDLRGSVTERHDVPVDSIFPPHILDALRTFNENPVRANGLGRLAILVEGPQVLLSALDQVAPDYEIDLEQTDLPAMMSTIVKARSEWFPPDSDWHQDAYGMIKVRLLEHDVRLDTMDLNAAIRWMKATGVQSTRVRDLRPVARRYTDAAGREIVADAVDFGVKNARRGFLIRKDMSTGLTQKEGAELARLEDEVSDYVNAVAPLPFAELENMEHLAREAETRLATTRPQLAEANAVSTPGDALSMARR